MKKSLSNLTTFCFILAIAGPLSFAQDFKQYPGSQEKPSQQSSSLNKEMDVQIYTTGDSFEKVCEFYKLLYKEVTVPFRARIAIAAPRTLQLTIRIMENQNNSMQPII